MNTGRTISIEKSAPRSPAHVVARGARQTLGGAVTVVGSVGCVAGKLLDGAGTVLDSAAGAVSGTVLLVGDVLRTTGQVLGSTVTGLGNTLTLTGGLVSGGSFVDAAGRPQAQPAPDPAGSGATAASELIVPGTTVPPAASRPRRSPSKKSRPTGPAVPSGAGS